MMNEQTGVLIVIISTISMIVIGPPSELVSFCKGIASCLAFITMIFYIPKKVKNDE